MFTSSFLLISLSYFFPDIPCRVIVTEERDDPSLESLCTAPGKLVTNGASFLSFPPTKSLSIWEDYLDKVQFAEIFYQSFCRSCYCVVY